MMTYKADRIAELADLMMRYKRAYYAGKPEISDPEYDRLEDELTKLSPDHPALQFIGSDIISESRKVEHKVYMLSLQKTYDLKELYAWKKHYDLVGTLKVDGNSISVVYLHGQIKMAKTRGNGRIGEDVTDKIKWVSDIVPHIINKNLEIRGELYCRESQFIKLVTEMEKLGLERPTSPRNIVAGLLGRKSHLYLSRFFNFFAFDVLFYDEPLSFDTEYKKYQWIKEQGFRLPDPELLKSQADIESYLEKVKQYMEEEEIGVDGAVFAYNQLSLHDSFGSTTHHPRYKMSFKWQGETAVSTIKNILWSTSRLGIVTPVAIVEPVYLSGAKITNITLHNAAHVNAYNLKVGDQIEIVRSGEVIPKFLQVVKAGPGKFSWPKNCPACGEKLIFDDVRLKCPNIDSCSAQQLRTILNWIHCVEIDDLSEKRLQHLVDMKLVNSVTDLYRLTVEDFLKLPLTKEKMAKKLYENIQKSKSLPLSRFLYGLGIEGGGLATWEKLLEYYPALDALLDANADDIVTIEGFAEKSANLLVSGLSAKQKVIKELLAVGVKPFSEELPATSGALSGKQIAITGILSKPRKEVEKMIKQAGGRPVSSVSKHTFAVVTNEPETTSSKMQKAKQFGVSIWSEDELYQYIGL